MDVPAHEFSGGSIDHPMPLHLRHAVERGGGDGDVEMPAFARAGMADVPGAVVADFEQRRVQRLLERATHPDPENERQLVAVVAAGEGERIVGGARYAATPTRGDCEFAVAIVDDWTGRGLARRLLDLLMDDARVRGFQRMEGFVLTTNAGMLALAKRLGFVESASSEGPTVRLVRRDLTIAG